MSPTPLDLSSRIGGTIIVLDPAGFLCPGTVTCTPTVDPCHGVLTVLLHLDDCVRIPANAIHDARLDCVASEARHLLVQALPASPDDPDSICQDL